MAGVTVSLLEELFVPVIVSAGETPRRSPGHLSMPDSTDTNRGATPAPAPLRDGAHDFDFLHGRWKVRNRRLKQPLTSSSEWYEFDAINIERPLWDGRANFEEYDGDSPQGRIRAVALRLYNPATKQWTIHWSNSANGTLDQPMTGSFRDGRGEFYNQEEVGGRSIFVRFIWSPGDANHCRWEQAFSADGGRTWETNWIMELTRAE